MIACVNVKKVLLNIVEVDSLLTEQEQLGGGLSSALRYFIFLP